MIVFVILESLLVSVKTLSDGIVVVLWSWVLLGEKDACSPGGKLGGVV